MTAWRRCRTVAAALAWCSATSVAAAEDVVYLTSDRSDSGQVAIRGQILDYTGEVITIQGPAGARRYAAQRVQQIDTAWPDDYQAAQVALAQHDYQAASRRLAAANSAESRVWVRRLILTDLMRCYEELGQLEQAGELLLAVVDSDPTSPALADAPLAWLPDHRVRSATAQAWLAQRDRPAAELLGASHLLATTAGDQAARQALARLLSHNDPRIAAQAEAQLWRSELLRATPTDVDRWAGRIEQMPESVRAGPYFVLGQAQERLNLADQAMLSYLRVPLQFDERHALAARALTAAGRLAKRAGHNDEASRLLGEVVTDYRDTPSHAEAQQLLEATP